MNITPVIGPLSWLFLLCCAFAAQYWAYRSHRELKSMNEKLASLLLEKGK